MHISFQTLQKNWMKLHRVLNFLALRVEKKGCVAYLDGFLLQIQMPSSNETGNVKASSSGHYQIDKITVQAACDYNCRFVYAALAAPGGANDIAALGKKRLS